MKRSVILSLTMMALLPNGARAFETQTGFEVLRSPDTTIESLHRLYVGQSMGDGFSLGQAIYSAASGDAGGAFFWGYEAVKAWPVGAQLSVFAQGFVGGGGGAAQVDGDGLMLRAALGMGVALNERLSLQFGLSRLAIKGGDEGATAVSIGLGYTAAPEVSVARSVPIRSVAMRAGIVQLDGARTRSGLDQPDLRLVGAEFAFAGGPSGEWWLQADGAAAGGDGYMQVIAGLRHRAEIATIPVFAETGIGFGGGGDVDTGGGVLVRAGLGASLHLTRAVDLDVSLARIWIPDTGSSGVMASAGLVRVFRRGGDENRSAGQDWSFSTGVSQQFPGAGFRKDPASSDGRPLMQETSVDLFLTERTYLTGNAQTVLAGDAAGYAIGLVGLGWRGALSDRIGFSVEGHLGAAGGGGIAVGSGALGSLRAEIDYRLKGDLWASLAFGRMQSLGGGGMAPHFLTLGLKVPFRTN